MMRTHINVADLTTHVDSLIDAIDVLIRKADDDLEDELKAEGYVETKKAVEIIEELEDGWTEAYNNHCDDLLEQLEKTLDLDDFVSKKWPKIESNEDLRDAIYEVFHDRFFSMLETSVSGWLRRDDSELFADLLDDGAKILSEPAKEFVEGWTVELSTLMHLNTNEQIGKILINGQENHLSVAQVAQNISDSGIRDPGYKARGAAITEVLRAESYGQLEAMRQNPAIIEKEWQHTGSHKNKPRENHVAISGQRVPVDQPFTLNGADGVSYSPMCPRDTNLPAGESISCHCMMKQIRDPKWNDLTFEEKQAAREQRMAELNGLDAGSNAVGGDNTPIKWPEKGDKISNDQYKEIMQYAKDRGVRLNGFKQFDGDISTVKELVDDVKALSNDFPVLLEGRKPVTINLNGYLDSQDFAVVGKGSHIININANAYRNVSRLQEEYQKLVAEGWFVQGTDYRSIIRHETGHVVGTKLNITNDAALDVVKKISGLTEPDEVINYLASELSVYSASFEDGSEILSECFSGAYSSGTKNNLALQVIDTLGIIQQKE